MRLAVTMGDPNGVGPEIALAAFSRGELPGDVVLVGDLDVLAACNRRLGLGVRLARVAHGGAAGPDALNVLSLDLLGEDDLDVGRVSEAAGRASLAYVERATRLALDRDVDAVVTLPVNKQAVRLAAPGFSGHTEYIAALSGTTDPVLMLVSSRAIVTHVSTHVSLREAIDRVRRERVRSVLRLTHDVLPRLRTTRRIAVAGLNPHAGEAGAFGREDQDEIAPAIEAARAEGIDATGPWPPDTVFLDVLKGRFDAVVCMYHDQGHIPLKVVDFAGGVNVTLGLPIVRTSVDHGTAFDIAWQGRASSASLREACRLACQLVGG